LHKSITVIMLGLCLMSNNFRTAKVLQKSRYKEHCE